MAIDGQLLLCTYISNLDKFCWQHRAQCRKSGYGGTNFAMNELKNIARERYKGENITALLEQFEEHRTH